MREARFGTTRRFKRQPANLFEGITPERAEELKRLWVDHQPRFNILDDLGRDGRFVMDAGQYRDVRFNHSALRVFWVASFAAWEGYRAVAEGVATSVYDLTRFRQVVETVLRILHADDSESITLPYAIPEPGRLPDWQANPHMRAAAELAHFAVGFKRRGRAMPAGRHHLENGGTTFAALGRNPARSEWPENRAGA